MMKFKLSIPLLLLWILLFLLVSCGSERVEVSENFKIVKDSTKESNASVVAEVFTDPDIRKMTMQEIVNSKDNYYTVVNIQPIDGSYYWGDLSKSPNKGWYGSYGGDFISIELSEIKYFPNSASFIMRRFGKRYLEDGSVQETDVGVYSIEIFKDQIIIAISEFLEGKTDVVLLNAYATLLE